MCEHAVLSTINVAEALHLGLNSAETSVGLAYHCSQLTSMELWRITYKPVLMLIPTNQLLTPLCRDLCISLKYRLSRKIYSRFGYSVKFVNGEMRWMTLRTSLNVCLDIIQNNRLIKYASRAVDLKPVAMVGLDPDPWISLLSVSMTCVLVCIPFVLIIAIKACYLGTGGERKAKSCCA